MAKFTAEEIRAQQDYHREQQQARLDFVQKLMDLARMWRFCENRACRRRQGCADPRACSECHKEDILRFQREKIVPWLRERYPTVQWGAPASVVEAQYEAAREAEREEEARRLGRAPATQSDSASTSGKREKKKRVPVHLLYDAGDV